PKSNAAAVSCSREVNSISIPLTLPVTIAQRAIVRIDLIQSVKAVGWNEDKPREKLVEAIALSEIQHNSRRLR
ncbi:MAG: hypothetical protein JW750_00745, partial [Anaerolineaceae bacterium]|nr:hypothetical protein [Anaerolineaceae bacterium]